MKKVLIIDDDKIFAKVLKDGLLARGKDMYEVTVAGDGEEGLAKIEKGIPDLIVLDIMMPKMGGIEFLKTLKSRAGDDGQIPQVLVGSQLSDFEKISEGIELGIRGYIVKSEASLESIIKKIENLLGNPVK